MSFVNPLSSCRWDWTTIIGYLTLAFIVLVLIPLTWTQYLYNVFYKKKDDASSIDSEEEHFSTSRVVQFLYRTSEVITNNALLRILLFLLLCGLCVTIVVLEMASFKCCVLKIFTGKGKIVRWITRLFGTIYIKSNFSKICLVILQ